MSYAAEVGATIGMAGSGAPPVAGEYCLCCVMPPGVAEPVAAGKEFADLMALAGEMLNETKACADPVPAPTPEKSEPPITTETPISVVDLPSACKNLRGEAFGEENTSSSSSGSLGNRI